VSYSLAALTSELGFCKEERRWLFGGSKRHAHTLKRFNRAARKAAKQDLQRYSG